jgi:hypothetical protein
MEGDSGDHPVCAGRVAGHDAEPPMAGQVPKFNRVGRADRETGAGGIDRHGGGRGGDGEGGDEFGRPRPADSRIPAAQSVRREESGGGRDRHRGDKRTPAQPSSRRRRRIDARRRRDGHRLGGNRGDRGNRLPRHPQNTFGHHQFRLLQHRRRDVQRLVQEAGYQRGPARPAHEEQARSLGRSQVRPAQGRHRQRDRTVQERSRGGLELRAGQPDVAIDERHVDLDAGVSGQLLLRGPRRAPQLPAGTVVRGLLWPGQPFPRPVVATGRRSKLGDDHRVEVQPADVVEPVGGDHVEPGATASHHADVQRAGTEVEDSQAPALGKDPVLDRGEVAGGGDGLGDRADRVEARDPGRADEDSEAGPGPGRRVGECHLDWRGAGDPPGLRGHPGEHGRDQVDHGDLAPAQPDGTVGEGPLRGRFERARMMIAGPERVGAGQQFAV